MFTGYAVSKYTLRSDADAIVAPLLLTKVIVLPVAEFVSVKVAPTAIGAMKLAEYAYPELPSLPMTLTVPLEFDAGVKTVKVDNPLKL